MNEITKSLEAAIELATQTYKQYPNIQRKELIQYVSDNIGISRQNAEIAVDNI